jgi:hypothetical protein
MIVTGRNFKLDSIYNNKFYTIRVDPSRSKYCAYHIEHNVLEYADSVFPNVLSFVLSAASHIEQLLAPGAVVLNDEHVRSIN